MYNENMLGIVTQQLLSTIRSHDEKSTSAFVCRRLLLRLRIEIFNGIRSFVADANHTLHARWH